MQTSINVRNKNKCNYKIEARDHNLIKRVRIRMQLWLEVRDRVVTVRITKKILFLVRKR